MFNKVAKGKLKGEPGANEIVSKVLRDVGYLTKL